MLRSALWYFKNDLRWATRVTSTIGSIFGLLLVALGFFRLIQGDWIGGIWMVFIGLFLQGAARMSYQQLLLRRQLEGEPVSRFMKTDVRTVPPETTIRGLVDDYVYRYHHKMFPVTRNGDLVGCVTTRQIKDVPREEWERRTVGEIAEQCSDQNTIGSEADAMQALSRMQRSRASRLMVVDDGHLRGVFSLKDAMELMATKVELGDE